MRELHAETGCAMSESAVRHGVCATCRMPIIKTGDRIWVHDQNGHECMNLCVIDYGAAAHMYATLTSIRNELQRIAERVSTQQNGAAMDCIGLAMAEVDAAIARAEGRQ